MDDPWLTRCDFLCKSVISCERLNEDEGETRDRATEICSSRVRTEQALRVRDASARPAETRRGRGGTRVAVAAVAATTAAAGGTGRRCRMAAAAVVGVVPAAAVVAAAAVAIAAAVAAPTAAATTWTRRTLPLHPPVSPWQPCGHGGRGGAPSAGAGLRGERQGAAPPPGAGAATRGRTPPLRRRFAAAAGAPPRGTRRPPLTGAGTAKQNGRRQHAAARRVAPVAAAAGRCRRRSRGSRPPAGGSRAARRRRRPLPSVGRLGAAKSGAIRACTRSSGSDLRLRRTFRPDRVVQSCLALPPRGRRGSRVPPLSLLAATRQPRVVALPLPPLCLL